MFMPETLSKRIVSIILLAVGIERRQVAEMSGFCDKTVKMVQARLNNGEIKELLKIGGGGRKSKTADVEEEIINEINSNQYHSRQQIADMIFEKHGIRLSITSIGNLLKKTKLNA
jgi:transposase